MQSSIYVVLFGDFGTDARVRRHTQALRDNGLDVVVYAYANSADDPPDFGPRVKAMRSSRPADRRFFATFFRYLWFGTWILIRTTVDALREKPAGVLVNNMPNFLVLLLLPTRLSGGRIILDVHDPMEELLRARLGGRDVRLATWLLRLEERLSLRAADAVMTVNAPMAVRIKGRFGVDPFVIHNGPTAIPERPAMAWDGKSPLEILHLGYVHQRQRLDLAIKALAELGAKVEVDGYEIDVILHIHGDGPEVPALKQLARQLNVEAATHFHGPFHPQEKPAIVNAGHLGLALYDEGPFADLLLPVKVLDFAAAGLPTIATDIAGVRQYLGDTMMYVTERASISSQILRFANHYVEARQRAAEARERVRPISWAQERRVFIRQVERWISDQ